MITLTPIAKSARPSMLAEHFGTPRKAIATLGRNPGHLAAGGAVGAAGAAQAPPLERRRTEAQRRRADAGTKAVLGGAAAQGAWLGTGYEIRRRGHKVERTRPEGMSRSQHQKIMREHHHRTGVPQNTKPDALKAPNFYRSYPEGLPATKYKRALGHMSGRKGALIQGGLVGAGAVGAAMTGRGRKQSVEKAMYVREERTKPLRVGELAAGAGLAAWGLGRSGVVGRALGIGVKAATVRGNVRAYEALRLAQNAQGALARGTAPGERALRQIRMVDQAIRKVPAPLRPEIAAAAGILLVGNAVPVNRKTYRPINPYSGRGW